MHKTHKKEESKSRILKVIKSGVSAVSDLLVNKVFPEVNEEVDIVLEKVEDKMLELEARIVRNLTASLVMTFALIALGLSGFYFLVESLNVPKAKAFLYLGFVLILISFMLKYNNLRKQTTEDKRR